MEKFVEKLKTNDYKIFLEHVDNEGYVYKNIQINTVKQDSSFSRVFFEDSDHPSRYLVASDATLSVPTLDFIVKGDGSYSTDFKDDIKNQWIAFMIARFGEPYVHTLDILKITPSKIFKHIDRFKEVLDKQKQKNAEESQAM